jgi:PAS domain S-box-containing protein
MAVTPSAPVIRTLTLIPELSDLARGRQFVADAAREAGFPGERVFDIIVASSEAMANAIEHTPIKGQVEITATFHPDRFEVQIEGPGEFQAPRKLEERSHRGLGLPLMAKLADHLALYSGPRGGTLVSLTFYRPGAEHQPEPLPPSIRELIEQNELTSAIAQNAPVGIYVLGPDLRYRWANRTYQSYLDEPYRSQDLTGAALEDAVPGAAGSGLLAEMECVSRTGVPVLREDGGMAGFERGPTWWRRSIVALRGEADQPPYDLVVVTSDETERRQREQALRESRERYQRLYENTLAGVFATSADGRLTAANTALARIFGYENAGQMLEKVTNVADSLYAEADDRARVLESLTGQEGPAATEEVRIKRRDGSPGWILLTAAIARDAEDRVTGFEGTAVDISERKRLEGQLKQREEQARHILEHAPAPVYQIDFRTPSFVGVNKHACEQSGYSREEFMAMSPFDLLDGPSQAKFGERLRRAAEGAQPEEYVDYTCVAKDGRRLSVALDVSFLYEDAKPVGALVVGHDVTGRKRAEEERQEAAGRVERVLQSITDGYYELDAGWRFVKANPEAEKHFGLNAGELLGRSIWEVTRTGSGQETYEQFHRARRDGKPLHFEAGSEIRPDYWAELHVYPTAAGVEVYFRDISGRKATEQQLRRSEERQALLLRLGDVLRPLVDPLVMRYQAARMLGEYLRADRVYFGEASLEEDLALVLPDYYGDGLTSIAGRYRMSDLASSFRVLKTGRPFSIADVETSGRLSERTRAACRTLGLGSFAAVPLIKSGKTVWSVNVAFVGQHQWIKDEISLIREVGDRTWSAVDRALAEAALRESEERHRALAQENERLYRQQLHIAENLQFVLLNIPEDIGPVRIGHLYRSATEAARVGGDFYDVFEVKDGSIAILIGDVAGPGIPAARTATLVKDVVHAFTHQSLRTQEVLRRTNLLLIEKELPGFVTVFLGILDRNTGRLRYSSAGHPETLLRRASGEIERLGCGYSPLGVYPDAAWKANEVDLQVDDLLILYTDGVIEARRNGEFFGEKRLERLAKRKRLSPQRLPHLILDQVLAFAGGNLEDDVAVLALSLAEVAGSPIEQAFRQESLLN